MLAGILWADRTSSCHLTFNLVFGGGWAEPDSKITNRCLSGEEAEDGGVLIEPEEKLHNEQCSAAALGDESEQRLYKHYVYKEGNRLEAAYLFPSCTAAPLFLLMGYPKLSV